MKVVVLLTCLSVACLPLFSQSADTRGLKTVVSGLAGETAVVGRQYAVLIAVDKYKGWMALRNPVRDAREIRDILARRYFVTDFVELYDEAATKAGIIKLFGRLIKDTKPEDSVFIFYAGHGHLDRSSNMGFWIPVDGGTDVFEQANWLPNGQVRGFISNMKARHIVLVADSCFSGDFLNPSRGTAPTISNDYFKKAYSRISRQVITSGASESVPDESSFTRQLKLALEGNSEPYLDPLMLYNQIRLGVTQTTPLFGDLKDSGHQEGSSFLLFLRPSEADGPAPVEAATLTEETTGNAEPPAETPGTSFTVTRVYGAIRVETRAAGDLYLDGVLQGTVTVGSIATIKNVEFGRHELEMRYPVADPERLSIIVDKEETVAARFTRTPTKAELAPLDPLPLAAIQVDGKMDDWAGVTPAINQRPRERGPFVIDKVFLAVDDKNLYLRFDIKDDTPSSLLHPFNFDTTHNSYYKVFFETQGKWVILEAYWNTDRRAQRWTFQLGREVDGTWTSDATSGRLAMKGSSMEGSYPLDRLRQWLGLAGGGTIRVRAQTGYSDASWKWVDFSGEETFSHSLTLR